MNNQENFWLSYKITENDLTRIFNHLLETESPATQVDLAKNIILFQIDNQKKKIESDQKSEGFIYYPKDTFNKSDQLVFPHLSWLKGKVIDIRSGVNPDLPDLQVIDVLLENNTTHISLASNLSEHKLNTPVHREIENWLDSEYVYTNYLSSISSKLKIMLDSTDDLVCIAGNYFPRTLLVDIGIGQLNLCEAILEMENGGPLSTQDLLSQIDLPTGVNQSLIEFSLEFALQEDNRFDEVGPSGKTLWFLNRLEPNEVQNIPNLLRFTEDLPTLPTELVQYKSFGAEQCDEFETEEITSPVESVTISLIYPHWRSGTLPLTSRLKLLFPTAYETPRIKFNFVETKNNFTFSGWVVRPSRYIYGLREWYAREGVIPGSLIHLSRGKNPGEVSIRVEKSKNSKEWIRTVLVGADGGVVIALLKQVVTCSFDERMALVTPDTNSLDTVWEKKSKFPMEKIVHQTMIELSKLNPQGQIHAQELYAAVNTLRRCPPSTILDLLFNQPWVKHLGDLYFKLTD